MTTKLNRRNWLKSTTLTTAGLAVGSSSSLFASTASTHQIDEKMRFWEWENSHLVANRDMWNLKARLLANENPYGPSPAARLTIMESVSKGNRYGQGDSKKLIEMIAEKEGVPKEYIMLGPGSSDLLEKTAITHFLDGGNIVSADPAYMSLIKTAKNMKAEWKAIPLTKSWEHDLPAMEAAVDAKTQLVYICNPNNPTGTITDSKALWGFCERVGEKKPIFVDEAYLEFMDPKDQMSMVGLLNKGKNVIISRTFSKVHGMAGIRVGYIVALPSTLEKIQAVTRSNMSMNVTAVKGAMASMKETAFLESCRVKNKECREYTVAELKKLGYEPLPSHTSFVLFPIAIEGREFLQRMFGESIGVRAFQIFGDSYARVSIGTMDEMKLFVDAFKKVMA
ncbi:MAG: histidinol-phosphate transaminase [Bacteroidota bacterium]